MTRTMNRINTIKTRSTATITTTAAVSQPKDAGAGILTRSRGALQALSETSKEKCTRTVCWKDTGLPTNHAVHEEASLLSTQVDESQRMAKWDAFIAFLEAHGRSVVKTRGQLGNIQKWAEKTMRYKAYDPTSRSKEGKHRVCSYSALTWSFHDDMELQRIVAAVFREMESCVSSTSPSEDTWSNIGDMHPEETNKAHDGICHRPLVSVNDSDVKNGSSDAVSSDIAKEHDDALDRQSLTEEQRRRQRRRKQSLLLSMLPPHVNNIRGSRNDSAEKPNGMHDCVSHFQCADNLPTSTQSSVPLSATSDDASNVSAALYHRRSLYFTPRLPTRCAPTTKVKYIRITGGRLICKWLRTSKPTHRARVMRTLLSGTKRRRGGPAFLASVLLDGQPPAKRQKLNSVVTDAVVENTIKTRSTATITTTAAVSQPKDAGAGILTRSRAALQALSETSKEKCTRTVCWKDTGLPTNHAVHEEASLLSTQVDESQRMAKWDAFIAFLEAHGRSVVKTRGQLGNIQKWAEKTMRYKAYDPTSRSKEGKHRVCSYSALTWSFHDDMELQRIVAAVFREMESCVSSTSPSEDTWSNIGDMHPEKTNKAHDGICHRPLVSVNDSDVKNGSSDAVSSDIAKEHDDALDRQSLTEEQRRRQRRRKQSLLLSMLPPHVNNIRGSRNDSAEKPNGMHDCVSHFQCADNLPTSTQSRVPLSATSDDASNVSAALYHRRSLYFTPRLPTRCAPTTKVKYIRITGGRLICKWLRTSKPTHRARVMRTLLSGTKRRRGGPSFLASVLLDGQPPAKRQKLNSVVTDAVVENTIKTRSTATITTTAAVSQPKDAGAGILTRSRAALQALSETSKEKCTRTVCWKDTGLPTNHAVHEEASLLSTQVDESQRMAKWDAFIAFLEAHGRSVVKTRGQLGNIQKWAEKTMRYKAYDPTSRSKEGKHRVCSYSALTWSFHDDMELQRIVAAVFREMESCVSSTSPSEDTWSNIGDMHPEETNKAHDGICHRPLVSVNDSDVKNGSSDAVSSDIAKEHDDALDRQSLTEEQRRRQRRRKQSLLLSMLPPHVNNIRGSRNDSAEKPNGMHDCVSHFQCADNLPTSTQSRVPLSATADDASNVSAALYHRRSLYFTPRLPTRCAPTTKVKYIRITGGRLICKWLRTSKPTHRARVMRTLLSGTKRRRGGPAFLASVLLDGQPPAKRQKLNSVVTDAVVENTTTPATETHTVVTTDTGAVVSLVKRTMSEGPASITLESSGPNKRRRASVLSRPCPKGNVAKHWKNIRKGHCSIKYSIEEKQRINKSLKCMLLQFSSRHILTLHGSSHQSARYGSKIGRRGKAAFSPTSPLATIAEEDIEAAETAASGDNHEVIETPVDDIDDTIFDSTEDAVPPSPKLKNPLPTPSTRVQWHHGNNLKTTTEYFVDMSADMVLPIVKSTGVQAPTILRPSSFPSKKVIFECGLEQDAKSANFLHLLEKYIELAEDESHCNQLLEKTVAVLCEYSSGPTKLIWNLFHFKPLLPFLDEYALEFIFSKLEGEDAGGFGSFWDLEYTRGNEYMPEPVRRSARLARLEKVNYKQ